MKLGDRVTFKKELKKDINTSTEETKQFYLDEKIITENTVLRRTRSTTSVSLPYVSTNPKWGNWGILEHEKALEGIVAGVRNIDMDGEANYYEGYYEFRNRLKVYLIATDLRGFHRVPEEFIIKGEI